MPHFVIDYAKDIEADNDLEKIVQEVHKIAIGANLFTPADVKTRAMGYEKYLAGEEQGSFIHVQISLLEGRTVEQKKTLVDPIFTYLKENTVNVTKVTVDIRDMDKDTYAK